MSIDWDKQLSRGSHIAQIVLVILAVFGYFYTVLPVYQNKLLNEQIAKKGLELSSLKKYVSETYISLRGMAVRRYVLKAGVKCSGLLEPPPPLSEVKEEAPGLAPEEPYVLGIDISDCLNSVFNSSEDLKTLNVADLNYLKQEIKSLSTNLETEHELAIKDYREFPERASLDPSILKPIDNYYMSRLTLLNLSKEDMDKQVHTIRLVQARQVIVDNYREKIRESVLQLKSIDWQIK